MRLYVNYDGIVACKVILQEQLSRLNIKCKLLNFGEIEVDATTSKETLKELEVSLARYGITIIDNQKNQLVQKIKDAIVELVYENDKVPLVTTSHYLADKLNFSYGYLSNLFSEFTYTSIENYIIIQKIERAKKLILEEDLNLTEISYKLNYSSLAHLSNQFKKVTGLTPSVFKRIVAKRKFISNN